MKHFIDELFEGIIKYWLLILYVVFGSFTTVLVYNQKKNIGFWASVAVFLCCSFIGATYAYAMIKSQNNNLLLLTGAVTMAGHNIVLFVIQFTKDPQRIKNLIVAWIKKVIS